MQKVHKVEGSYTPYDIDKMSDADVLAYEYHEGIYDGSGNAIYRIAGKWYHHNMGHCSCYGPFEEVNRHEVGANSLTALVKSFSKELKTECAAILKLLSRYN